LEFIVNEDQPIALPVNQTGVTVNDFDGNGATAFRIRSLPASGQLKYNNALFSAPADFVVSNAGLLTFVQTVSNEFSIISTGTTCNTAYTTFNFVASDGICDSSTTAPSAANCNSPAEATARICVKDVQDLPYGPDQNLSDVRAGSNRVFSLIAIDDDDFKIGKSDNQLSTFAMRLANNSFRSQSGVTFNATKGKFGEILLTSDGVNCAGAASPNTLLHAFDSQNLKFCYASNGSAVGNTNQDILGIDTFYFTFTDGSGASGPPSKFQFFIVNPIDVCSDNVPALPSPATTCVSYGPETARNQPGLIPIYLTGKDALNRQIFFRVTQLPAHGKLYLSIGNQKGAEITLSTDIPAMTGNSPNVIYQGDLDYFNRIIYQFGPNPMPFRNRVGLGLDGCKTSAVSCRCPISVDPGCPDTFLFRTFVQGSTATSKDGVYRVYVNSVPSDFPLITAPSAIQYSRGIRFNLEGLNNVSFNDPDDDVYMISVRMNPNPGQFGIKAVPENDANTFKLDRDSGGYTCIEGGCSSVIDFYGIPTLINQTFQSMYFVHNGIAAQGAQILIDLYKAIPDGTNEANAVTVYTLPSSTAIFRRASIDISLAGASPSGSGASGLDIAIYAGASAAGFLLLVCCINGCIWFTRKSRQAAKAARKSMASRKSQAHRQSHHTGIADVEDFPDDTSREERVPFCCCFGTSRRDSEEFNEADRAALAHQRQSVASHQSHHSVRSAAQGRQSQGLVAYQPTPSQYTAEAPAGPRGREMVAPSLDGQELQVADDSVFAWEKHIDRRTGDVYFFNPRTGVSQWDPPTIKVKRTGK